MTELSSHTTSREVSIKLQRVNCSVMGENGNSYEGKLSYPKVGTSVFYK